MVAMRFTSLFLVDFQEILQYIRLVYMIYFVASFVAGLPVGSGREGLISVKKIKISPPTADAPCLVSVSFAMHRQVENGDDRLSSPG